MVTYKGEERMTRDLEYIKKQPWYTPGSESTVIIDFDGTICEFAYPESGLIIKDVREAFKRLKEAGIRILIHSSRTSSVFDRETREKNLEDMKDFLDTFEIPYDGILTHEKPPVLAYIDDSAFRLTGNKESSNWMEIVNQILIEKEHGRK